MTTPDTGI